MRTIALAMIALLVLASTGHSQRAQEPPADVPSCKILRTRAPVIVDGRADEADWKAAAPIDCPRAAPAWKLLSTVVNNALSYDSCILPPALLRPFAEKLDECVLALASKLAGSQATQLRLPRNAGGCGMPSAVERSITGFLATYLRCPPPHSTSSTGWASSGLPQAAEESLQALRHMGVHVDAWGMPHSTEPAHPFQPSTM